MPALRPAPDVVVEEQEGEAFLLHVRSGRYYSLNPAGVVAWRALADGRPPETALRETYPDIDVDRLRADLEALLDELHSEGLVEEADPAE